MLRKTRMQLYTFCVTMAAMEDELSFKAGDRMVKIADCEDSGW